MRSAPAALLLTCLALPAAAQEAADEPLDVAVVEAAPFAYRSDDGVWQGAAAELWRHLADSLDVTYDLRTVPAERLARALAADGADLALNAPLVPELADQITYGRAYAVASLGVAGRGEQDQPLVAVTQALLQPTFWWLCLSLSILLLVVGAAAWLVERKANANQFGGDQPWYRGIGAGFWWAGVTMTTIGYGDKAPSTFWGRALALLWMLVALAVTASLTAAPSRRVPASRARCHRVWPSSGSVRCLPRRPPAIWTPPASPSSRWRIPKPVCTPSQQARSTPSSPWARSCGITSPAASSRTCPCSTRTWPCTT